MNRTLVSSVVCVSLLSLSACLIPKQQVSVGSTGTGSSEIGRQVLVRVMPQKGNIKDEKHGKEIWFAYGAVTGANGVSANGIATAHFLEDKTYVIDVQMNMYAPERGTLYDVWLSNGDPKSPISIGHLTEGIRPTRQVLRFETTKDLRDRLTVAITTGKSSAHLVPGEVVATGLMKVTKR